VRVEYEGRDYIRDDEGEVGAPMTWYRGSLTGDPVWGELAKQLERHAANQYWATH
jgi:hypothetical protein